MGDLQTLRKEAWQLAQELRDDSWDDEDAQWDYSAEGVPLSRRVGARRCHGR